MKPTYQQKYNAVKNTFMFAKCRLNDAWAVFGWEFVNSLGVLKLMRLFNIPHKPKPDPTAYRRWCINEWLGL